MIADADCDDISRKILYLHYIKHKDFGFIADEIGIAASTAYRRHNEALRILRRYIKR